MVSASCDKTVKIFNTYLRRCLGTFSGHQKAVAAVECIPQYAGGAIISSSFDGLLKVWATHKTACLTSIEIPVAFKIRRTKDDNVFMSAHCDGVVRIWDHRVGNFLVGSSSAVTGEEFHDMKLMGDNTCVVGSDLGTLRTFDSRVLDKFVHSWQAHTSRISSLDISPTSALVSGSFDGTVKIWDPQFRKELSSFSLSKFGNNVQAVTGVVFVNERNLFVSSSDSVLRLIDTQNQICLHKFHHHNAPIFKLSYDGTRFVTCGLDNIFVVGEFYQNCKLVKWAQY